MTRWRRLHAGAVVLTLVGGCGALGLRVLSDAKPVSVADAVARFRQGQSATPSPGSAGSPTPTPSATGGTAPGTKATAKPGTSAAPTATARPNGTAAPKPGTAGPSLTAAPEGVYVYATTGHETGDAGPTTSRHDYPSETTWTIRRSGCGSSLRWEPVEGRWDDVTDCGDGRTSKIRTYDTMHTFYGISERMTYQCSGDSWLRPPSTTAGYRWEFDCVSERAKTHTEARIVGIERVAAGDGTVRALHVRFDTTLSGSSTGTNPSDYWLALDGPYMVRKTGRVDATVRTEFGTLDYHEEYDVRLVSRRPRT